MITSEQSQQQANDVEVTPPGNAVGDMPIIQTEEELLATTGIPVQGDQESQADNTRDSEGDNDNPAPNNPKGENDDSQDPSKYPSMLHYLNKVHDLKLNLKDDEKISREDEARGVSELLSRMTNGVNRKVGEYTWIADMMKDEEVKALLDAKKEKKGLRDLYQKFALSPSAQSDEELALSDFKKRYPKSGEEAIKGMINSLKQSGQFDGFVKGLREQHEEEERTVREKSEADQKLAAEQEEQRMVQLNEEYKGFVSKLEKVHDMPLTDQQRSLIEQADTVVDEDGMTSLDYALQSNEGRALASIGVFILKDLLHNAASRTGNRKIASFQKRLFDTPDQLQSGQSAQENQEPDMALLNQF